MSDPETFSQMVPVSPYLRQARRLPSKWANGVFVTMRETLIQESGFVSFLLSGRRDNTQADGSYPIDADAESFGQPCVIFDALSFHPSLYLELLEEAKYFRNIPARHMARRPGISASDGGADVSSFPLVLFLRIHADVSFQTSLRACCMIFTASPLWSYHPVPGHLFCDWDTMGHEANYGARSRARERAYSNSSQSRTRTGSLHPSRMALSKFQAANSKLGWA
jgi:hypothetical protein